MNLYMIILRAIHVAAAVFWVGGTFFFLAVISPTVQEAGPAGGQFMQRLAASGRITARFTLAAILTALSGLLMYWSVSGGFNGTWLRTGYGIVLTIGAVAGLLALGHGFFASRPASDRLGALAKEMIARNGPPTPEQMKEAQALSAKVGSFAVQTAVIMSVALLAMGTAQYF
jgi:putative copper export protein